MAWSCYDGIGHPSEWDSCRNECRNRSEIRISQKKSSSSWSVLHRCSIKTCFLDGDTDTIKDHLTGPNLRCMKSKHSVHITGWPDFFHVSISSTTSWESNKTTTHKRHKVPELPPELCHVPLALKKPLRSCQVQQHVLRLHGGNLSKGIEATDNSYYSMQL